MCSRGLTGEAPKHLDKKLTLHYKPLQQDKRLDKTQSAAIRGMHAQTGGWDANLKNE